MTDDLFPPTDPGELAALLDEPDGPGDVLLWLEEAVADALATSTDVWKRRRRLARAFRDLRMLAADAPDLLIRLDELDPVIAGTPMSAGSVDAKPVDADATVLLAPFRAAAEAADERDVVALGAAITRIRTNERSGLAQLRELMQQDFGFSTEVQRALDRRPDIVDRLVAESDRQEYGEFGSDALAPIIELHRGLRGKSMRGSEREAGTAGWRQAIESDEAIRGHNHRALMEAAVETADAVLVQEVKRALLHEGIDPNERFRSGGPEMFERVMATFDLDASIVRLRIDGKWVGDTEARRLVSDQLKPGDTATAARLRVLRTMQEDVLSSERIRSDSGHLQTFLGKIVASDPAVRARLARRAQTDRMLAVAIAAAPAVAAAFDDETLAGVAELAAIGDDRARHRELALRVLATALRPRHDLTKPSARVPWNADLARGQTHAAVSLLGEIASRQAEAFSETLHDARESAGRRLDRTIEAIAAIDRLPAWNETLETALDAPTDADSVAEALADRIVSSVVDGDEPDAIAASIAGAINGVGHTDRLADTARNAVRLAAMVDDAAALEREIELRSAATAAIRNDATAALAFSDEGRIIFELGDRFVQDAVDRPDGAIAGLVTAAALDRDGPHRALLAALAPTSAGAVIAATTLARGADVDAFPHALDRLAYALRHEPALAGVCRSSVLTFTAPLAAERVHGVIGLEESIRVLQAVLDRVEHDTSGTSLDVPEARSALGSAAASHPQHIVAERLAPALDVLRSPPGAVAVTIDAMTTVGHSLRELRAATAAAEEQVRSVFETIAQDDTAMSAFSAIVTEQDVHDPVGVLFDPVAAVHTARHDSGAALARTEIVGVSGGDPPWQSRTIDPLDDISPPPNSASPGVIVARPLDDAVTRERLVREARMAGAQAGLDAPDLETRALAGDDGVFLSTPDEVLSARLVVHLERQGWRVTATIPFAEWDDRNASARSLTTVDTPADALGAVRHARLEEALDSLGGQIDDPPVHTSDVSLDDAVATNPVDLPPPTAHDDRADGLTELDGGFGGLS